MARKTSPHGAWSVQHLGQSKLPQGNLGVLNLNSVWLLSRYSAETYTENPYRNEY